MLTATDANGRISKVEFYSGTKLLHTQYEGNYSYPRTNVPLNLLLPSLKLSIIMVLQLHLHESATGYQKITGRQITTVYHLLLKT